MNSQKYSIEIREFIQQCLKIQPDTRPTLKQLKNHIIFQKLRKNLKISNDPEISSTQNYLQLVKTIEYDDFEDKKTIIQQNMSLKVIFDIVGQQFQEGVVQKYLGQNLQSPFTPTQFLDSQSTQIKKRILEKQIFQENFQNPLRLFQYPIEIFSANIEFLYELLEREIKQILPSLQKGSYNYFKQNMKNLFDDKASKYPSILQKLQDNDKNSNQSGGFNILGFLSKDTGINQQPEEQNLTKQKETQPEIQSSIITNTLQPILIYMNILFNEKNPNMNQIMEIMIQYPLPSSLRSAIWQKILKIPSQHIDVVANQLNDSEILNLNKQKDISQLDFDIKRSQIGNPLIDNQFSFNLVRNVVINYLKISKQNEYFQGFDKIAMILVQTFNLDIYSSTIALNNLNKNYIKMGQISALPDEILLVHRGIIFKQLLYFEDPNLALYLETINFVKFWKNQKINLKGPEIYAVSWFINLFSVVFNLNSVQKIWDFALCQNHFIITFSVSLMCELKDQLHLKGDTELMESIRNLEGIVDINNCLIYSEYLARTLPQGLWKLNYVSEQENLQMSQNQEIYGHIPWEIPPSLEQLKERKIYHIGSTEAIKINPIFIDIRTEAEFKEYHIQNSLFMHYQVNKKPIIPNIVIQYLEQCQEMFFNFDTMQRELQQIQEGIEQIGINNNYFNQIGQQYCTPRSIQPFVLVYNYEKPTDISNALQYLLEKGIKRLFILTGGIQIYAIPNPQYDHKITMEFIYF